nr:MAG TPA: hypothetical protein [Caudoviricetes sp.]DAN28123.1 MAG TPA: hypothetical protein [Caudoviricetes sp.]
MLTYYHARIISLLPLVFLRCGFVACGHNAAGLLVISARHGFRG